MAAEALGLRNACITRKHTFGARGCHELIIVGVECWDGRTVSGARVIGRVEKISIGAHGAVGRLAILAGDAGRLAGDTHEHIGSGVEVGDLAEGALDDA